MLLSISMALIIAVMFFLLVCMICPIRLTIRQIRGLWLIQIIAVACLSYLIKPGFSLDLYRIYNQINLFRDGRAEIFDTPFFVLNFFYWLVSKTPNNGWFPFFGVLIFGLFADGILKNYLETNYYATKAVMLYFLASYGGFFVIYLLAGVRSVVVAAVWVYAYQKYFKNNKKRFFLIVTPTIFIHLLAIVLLVIVLLYSFCERKNTFKSYIIAIIIVGVVGYTLNSDIILSLIGRNNSAYLMMFSENWKAYRIRDYQFQQTGELILRAVTAIYYLVCSLYLSYKGNKKNNIIIFIVAIMFVGFNMSILFERLPYVLGIASLPILNEVTTIQSDDKNSIVISYLLFIFGAIVIGAQFVWGVRECVLWLDF